MIRDALKKFGWKAAYAYQTLTFSHGLNVKKWIKSSKDAIEFDRILTQVYVGEINSLDEVILEISIKNLGSDCSEEKLDFLAKTIWRTGTKARKHNTARLSNQIVSDLDFNSLYPSTQALLTMKEIQHVYPTLINSHVVTVPKLLKPIPISALTATISSTPASAK